MPVSGMTGPCDEGSPLADLLGDSPAMQQVCQQLRRAAPTSATVLLTGESGTGKELAARALHQLSPRSAAPFVALNCGAISPQLIESELFGHERGSFTGAARRHPGFFERAHGGTLFLDEVTEMSPELQVKLLRVLESAQFQRIGATRPQDCDVRVVAATNRSPEQAVSDGRLREDLYYRLAVFPLALPPLRQRGADVVLLAEHFLAQLNREAGSARRLADGARQQLLQHCWPGNVRELRNYVRRAYLLADGEIIDAPLLPGHAPRIDIVGGDEAGQIQVRIGATLAEADRQLILATLARCGGVRKQAAEMLGVSLKTLYNRLQRYADDGAAIESDVAPEGLVEQ